MVGRVGEIRRLLSSETLVSNITQRLAVSGLGLTRLLTRMPSILSLGTPSSIKFLRRRIKQLSVPTELVFRAFGCNAASWSGLWIPDNLGDQ